MGDGKQQFSHNHAFRILGEGFFFLQKVLNKRNQLVFIFGVVISFAKNTEPQ